LEALALRRLDAAESREHDEPAAVPWRAHCRINPPMRRVLDAAPPELGQAVIAAPADRRGGEPAVLRQAVDARPHQPLVEAKRSGQPDQAAEPDGPAMGRNAVAPERQQQRLGAWRELG